jgi:hypothetical protein
VTGSGWLTCADFAPHVGERFEVAAEGGSVTVPMVLAEATEGTEPGGPGPDGEVRLQFSLVFRGPHEPALPQGTFPVAHADLGDLVLFLVPIGRDSDGLRYEAAFA